MTIRLPGNRLTKTQQKIVDAIETWCKHHPYLPTYRDLCASADIASPSNVVYQLRRLEAMGVISRDPGKSRSIRLVKDEAPVAPSQVSLRILGRIQAGLPIPIPSSDFSLFDSESVLSVAADLLPRSIEELYALEVQGDSMVDAMVADGDIVVLRSVRQANNGEMVAAWLKREGETTLKRYYMENGRVRLQPANRDYQPIYAEPSNVEIQGLVVLVVRKMGRFS